MSNNYLGIGIRGNHAVTLYNKETHNMEKQAVPSFDD